MGPLDGVKVLELGGIGPGPFCAMMLADLGAEVVRIERKSGLATDPAPNEPLLRNRRSVALDIKSPAGISVALRLVERSDILLEGFRPGVAERLGAGPEDCLKCNPRLVYGRVTGWGQEGPLAQAAGHDINYIALSGVLHLIGPRGGKPVPPFNFVGDFGGGGMLLAVGVLAALQEAKRTGHGQVVDAAMVDGAAAMLSIVFGSRSGWYFRDATGENILSGAAPYYDTYQTKDGKYVAIGSIEPQFYAALLEKLGLDVERFGNCGFPHHDDTMIEERWPELRAAIAAVFLTRTRAQWCEIMHGSEVCFAPVLSVAEAAHHPHNAERRTFIKVAGVLQNAPAPRFSRTPAGQPQPPRRPGTDTSEVLIEAGFTEAEVQRLRTDGVLT